MIVTGNEALASRMRMLSCFGMTSAWERRKSDEIIIPRFVELGYNYKLSDVAAAIMLMQMKKVDVIIRKKRELAEHYGKALKGIDSLTPPYVDASCMHAFQNYVVMVDEKLSRNRLISLLRNEGIEASFGTYALHLQPVYGSKSDCPNALHAFDHSLSLPMFHALTFEQIDFIVAKLKSFVSEA